MVFLNIPNLLILLLNRIFNNRKDNDLFCKTEPRRDIPAIRPGCSDSCIPGLPEHTPRVAAGQHPFYGIID